MSARYVIRPRAIDLGDDYWPDERLTLTILEEDIAPRDTGLVDQFGIPIVRLSPKIPAGFCR